MSPSSSRSTSRSTSLDNYFASNSTTPSSSASAPSSSNSQIALANYKRKIDCLNLPTSSPLKWGSDPGPHKNLSFRKKDIGGNPNKTLNPGGLKSTNPPYKVPSSRRAFLSCLLHLSCHSPAHSNAFTSLLKDASWTPQINIIEPSVFGAPIVAFSTTGHAGLFKLFERGPLNMFLKRGVNDWRYSGLYALVDQGGRTGADRGGRTGGEGRGMSKMKKEVLERILERHWTTDKTIKSVEELTKRVQKSWGFKGVDLEEGKKELGQSKEIGMYYALMECVGFDEESFGVWDKVRSGRQ